MIRGAWLILLACSVSFGGVAGQEPPRRSFVTGIVVGAYSQAPIEAAQVTLLDAAGGIVGTAVAGVEGLWGLEGDRLAAVTEVRVKAPGYDEWRSEGDVLGRGLRSELLRPGEEPPRIHVPPTDAEIVDRCAPLADPATGMLSGRIVDEGSGVGLAGIEAVVDWGALEPPRIVVGGRMEVTSLATVTEGEGEFLFCSVPPERPVRVIGRAGALAADSLEVQLEAGRVHRVEVQLSIGPGGSTPRP